MKRTVGALALAAAILISQTAEATLTIVKKDNLDLNWYFRNTSTKYTASSPFVGYYRDYDNDGLPDYLVLLKDPVNRDWRLFALNTAPTGLEKLYPTHRTAGRDIAAQLRVFVPDMFYTPEAPSMDSPDLVVIGTDDITTDSARSLFTRFIFWRLNKTNTAFPTEATWTVNVTSSQEPRVYWPDVSYDGDDYPDFFVYNSRPNASRQFVLSCYNGRTGALIWTRIFYLDPQDPGTGITVGPSSFGLPQLDVSVLPHQPEHGIVGDFDANGKPEIFLHYTFGKGTYPTSYSMTADINLLNSSGNFLSPYTAIWTRISQVNSVLSDPGTLTVTDYNRDGFVDLMLLFYMGGQTIPLFQGYNLKTRQFMFQSLASDFGTGPQDTSGYLALDQYGYYSLRPTDANGDGWSDLDVYRSSGFPPNTPLRVGLFNAYAGGGSQKGRKIWLQQFDAFNRAYSNVNDFNGDSIEDYLLLRDPTEPSSPTAGLVTWRIANTATTRKGIALGKQFDYSPPHSFAWDPLKDSFDAFSGVFYRLGDIDGDGQRDTVGSVSCSFDAGKNGVIDLSYGHLFVYDNTPGLTPPPLTAELQFKVQGENWTPLPMLQYAYARAGKSFVDNDRDGYYNDVLISLSQAIFSMSFRYHVIGGPPKIETAALSDFDGNGADAGDQLVLSLDRGVVVTTSVLRASHFFLPVAGDSLGGSGFRANVNPYNSRRIVLTLGQGARLTPPGLFSMSRRTSGSPSGIDFATSLPVGVIKSFDGISATNGGNPAVNDSGVDIQFDMMGGAGNIGPRGGTVSPVNSADAAYTQHYLTIPPKVLGTTITFRLRTPASNKGVPGAVQFASDVPIGNLTGPFTIGVQYREGDIDWDSGYIEGEMHVHQLVGSSFVPLPGVHRLERRAFGVRKSDTQTTNIVSVDVNHLGTTGVYAGLPIETVDERTIHIKPGGAGIAKGSGTTTLSPDSFGAYTLHRVEFLNYVETSPTDPARLVVTIRTATLAERFSLTGGQSFPSQSGAVFVVEVADALGQPLSFTSPVNLTVQFKERPDPALSDVVRFDGRTALPASMSLVRDRAEGEGVDFAFVNPPSQTVNPAQGTVTVTNYVGLTGADGCGMFGAVAPTPTPAASWALYR